ncbi:MAG: hypothetical protein QXG05_07340 [Nitrososphaerota archaeon]
MTCLTFLVLFHSMGDVDQMVKQLQEAYIESYSENPSIEQASAWKGE